MTSGYGIGLYAQGLFDTDDNATNRAALAALSGSGFTDLILFTLHVHPSGDLYLGDHVIARDGKIVYLWKDTQNPSFPELVKGLRAGGFRNVLFSIGFGGPPTPEDWQHIQDLLDRGQARVLAANFKAVADWTGVDGYDFDCEEDVRTSTIADMATLLAPFGASGVITLCPYDKMDWWLDCLAEIHQRHGNQLVRGLNLQVYGGAIPGDWLTALSAAKARTGVRDPAGFLSTGYLVAPPAALCPEFAEDGRLGLRSGFLWQYGSFDRTPKEYAAAVRDGLSGGPCA
ncbi:hypothetical protein [Streptomyces sp. TLI_171]|uniref:hypothetical protein n=1 Tax=Streptomyces sp. TLI_171 TaxID=1938859 RepID=UPI000C1815AE|nr:hypothetical protein [Streptomyces sp. TLI_171]RKE23109.1 hypothetical protein BX266_6566 [Streptomyces sp. TLI_171]